MKPWENFKSVGVILAVAALAAGIYRSSFLSPFFQDDKLLLQLSFRPNWFLPIGHFPYRPLAIGLFYWLGRQISGTNPLGFHLLEFGFYLWGLFLIYLLAKRILPSTREALLAVYFFGLNISLFADFYWIATSYFSLGLLFFLVAVWFFDRREYWGQIGAMTFFILTILTNELGFVLPLIFVLWDWYFGRKRIWRYLTSLGLAGILLLLRRYLISLPVAADYSLGTGWSVIPSLRWYLLRALNLPEGVNRSGGWPLWVSALGWVGTFAAASIRNIDLVRSKSFVFGLVWFVVAALPFYFLPHHMSAYYITIALFGPAVIFARVTARTTLWPLAVGFYLMLTIQGLDFLAKTHWIILKNTGPIGQF